MKTPSIKVIEGKVYLYTSRHDDQQARPVVDRIELDEDVVGQIVGWLSVEKIKRRVLPILKAVTDYAAKNTCLHEETHRGGAIWEICDQCGMKWADDEGGMPTNAHELPKEIEDAYDLISELGGAV
jgi:ribosomal protein L37AE/L43A